MSVLERSMRAGGLPPATRVSSKKIPLGLTPFNEGRGVTPGDATYSTMLFMASVDVQ